MRENLYGPDQTDHAARQRFVYKGEGEGVRKPATPDVAAAWYPTRHQRGASERPSMGMQREAGR